MVIVGRVKSVGKSGEQRTELATVRETREGMMEKEIRFSHDRKLSRNQPAFADADRHAWLAILDRRYRYLVFGLTVFYVG